MPSPNEGVDQSLEDYYRIAADSLPWPAMRVSHPFGPSGFFRFRGQICYGQSHSGTTPDVTKAAQFNASNGIAPPGPVAQLPFLFSEVIENLRLERYQSQPFAKSELLRRLYYMVRGRLPVSLRRQLQKAYFSDWKTLPFPSWPVDFTVDSLHRELLRLLMEVGAVKKVPFIWFWPEGARSCLIMTHDVETVVGRDFSSALMDLDDSFGIKASFQVIPEGSYSVPDDYVSEIRRRQFEFNIHDLNHDGNLYRKRQEFERRAERINAYVRSYGARGFRAGSMYRRQDWYDVFQFSYDMSVPSVAHLEPMRGGCCTVMPYLIGNILELPLTLTQDYSLLHIFNDYSIEFWKRQLALVGAQNGLMSFIVHPDYLIERRAQKVYESLLHYLNGAIVAEHIWAALPGDVDRWWRARSQMSLVRRGDTWEIVGAESEKARLAFAVLDGDSIVYELAEIPASTAIR
jgi:hypothetical protein